MRYLLELIGLFYGIEITIVTRKVTGRERRKLIKQKRRNR